MQSLALVSEIIYGIPSRFDDPARFFFAHSGKDGHPFPVPLKIYDETVRVLIRAIQSAKIGDSDRRNALKSLHRAAVLIAKTMEPEACLKKVIGKELRESSRLGCRTV